MSMERFGDVGAALKKRGRIRWPGCVTTMAAAGLLQGAALGLLALATLAQLCSAGNRPLPRQTHTTTPEPATSSPTAKGRVLHGIEYPEVAVLEGPVDTWPRGLTTNFPYNYFEWCDFSPVCQETGPAESTTSYHADPGPFISNINNWPFSFADQAPGTGLQALSGVVEFKQSTTADGYICNSTAICTMTFTLPIDPFVYQSSSTTAHKCILLAETEDGNLSASDDNTLVVTDLIVRDRLLCYGNLNSRYMAVQYTKIAAAVAPSTDSSANTADSGDGEVHADLPECPHDAEHLLKFVDGRLRLSAGKIMLFEFVFDIDYYGMFYPKGLGTYTANFPAFAQFNTLARQSLIYNIAAKTGIRVETAICELEIGRIKVMSTGGGGVNKTVMDISFLVPSTATKQQVEQLSSMVKADAAAFFKGPFEDKYHVHVHLSGHQAALLDEDQITLVAGMLVLASALIAMGMMVLIRKHQRRRLVAEMKVIVVPVQQHSRG
jgi:hypothetical protein